MTHFKYYKGTPALGNTSPDVLLKFPLAFFRAFALIVIVVSFNGGVAFCALERQSAGEAAVERGDFEAAVTAWREEARRYEANRNASGRIRALVNLAEAYQELGRPELALTTLEMARDAATRSADKRGLIAIKNSLGSLYTRSGKSALAEPLLMESLALAEQEKDSIGIALVANNLGNLFASQERDALAQQNYLRCTALAAELRDWVLSSRATLNLAALLAREGQNAQASGFCERVWKNLFDLPDSHDKAQLCLAVSYLFQTLAGRDEKLLDNAAQPAREAQRIAEKIGDSRSLSSAFGYLGAIAEKQGRHAEAVPLTRRARFLAQQTQSPHLLYQWEWQMARLLKAQGQTDEAIGAYRRAVETHHTLCDCAGCGGDAPASFRETVGPLYYQLADLLLQRANSGIDAQKNLAEARDTLEILKTAEIEDYFHDICVTVGQAKVRDVEAVLQNAAAIYYVPLPDRTEILLGLPSGWRRFFIAMGAGALNAKARRLRLHLERPSSDRYLIYAQELYEALIRPLEATLRAEKVGTLVFVPDGALRAIPLAALHDGQQFLIEKFNVAVVPGLTLMDPRPLPRGKISVLAGGVSEAVQGFDSLPGVSGELGHIRQNYDAKELLNADFTKAAVQRRIAEGAYQIIHIASHGEFNGDPQQTYLLTYDGRLTLNDLEDVIRPHQYRGVPVELLVLSACQTAAGDDRAALGLAGVALKSGARSALATLWSVGDEASAELMNQFYSALKKDPSLSKAAALRMSQIALLKDKRFQHPALWSPYLLIGNWL